MKGGEELTWARTMAMEKQGQVYTMFIKQNQQDFLVHNFGKSVDTSKQKYFLLGSLSK